MKAKTSIGIAVASGAAYLIYHGHKAKKKLEKKYQEMWKAIRGQMEGEDINIEEVEE